MKFKSKFNVCIVGAIMISFLTKSIECLLFSQFTLLQVVIAISWPIPYKNPLRKIFFNIGFQFNYGEPFLLSNFFNATYFQNPFSKRKLQSNGMESVEQENMSETSTLNLINGSQISTTIDSHSTGDDAERKAKTMNIRSSEQRYPFEYANNKNNELIGMDLTAAQLYEGLEEHLFTGGYHRNCLLKSICELARHPLHQDDEEHLLVEVVHFLLTPSQHNGFASHEKYEQEKYEAAEKIGVHGGDCDRIYSECETSFLDQISYITTAKAFM